MRPIKYFLVLSLVVLGTHAIPASDEVQVGRYSTMKTLPTDAQKNIFATVVHVQFDSTIKTVGDAMRNLLQDQGIRLAVPKSKDACVRTLIALPLPRTHRNLGPISLQRALETLAGPVWRLVQDPIHRLVSFELCNGEGEATDE